MNIESVVLFAVLLFLSLLGLGIRWLNEKIKRDIALKELKDLFLPSDTPQAPPDRVPPQPTRMAQKPIPPISPPQSASPLQGRGALRRLRLHNRTDLRQGIIIMTVLGPCRALDTSRDDRSFS